MNEEQTRIRTRKARQGETKDSLKGGEGAAGKKFASSAAKKMARPEIELREVDGCDGRYYVDRSGLVWSRYYNGSKVDHWKPLRQKMMKNGYLSVCLVMDDGKKTVSCHRLVAAAFIDRIPGKEHVNHINSVRSDNRAENLEWCTMLENSAHCKEAGRTMKGESHTNSKLNHGKVDEIRALFSQGKTQAFISRAFKISPSNIQRICRNQIWIK